MAKNNPTGFWAEKEEEEKEEEEEEEEEKEEDVNVCGDQCQSDRQNFFLVITFRNLELLCFSYEHFGENNQSGNYHILHSS